MFLKIKKRYFDDQLNKEIKKSGASVKYNTNSNGKEDIYLVSSCFYAYKFLQVQVFLRIQMLKLRLKLTSHRFFCVYAKHMQANLLPVHL